MRCTVRLRLVSIALPCCLGCAAAQPSPEPPSSKPATASSVEVAPATSPPAGPGHTDVEAPKQARLRDFKDHPQPARRTLFLQNALDATFTKDGATGFVRGKYGGWFVRGLDAATAQPLRISEHIDGYSLAADGQHLAIRAPQWRILGRSGRQEWAGQEAPPIVTLAGTQTWPWLTFIDAGFLYYDGCRLQRFSDPKSAGQTVFPSRCGSPAASADARYWAILPPTDELARLSYATGEIHAHASILDSNGAVVHEEPGPIVWLTLAPKDHTCFMDPSQRLTCLNLLTKRRVVLHDGPVYPAIDVDETGQRMVFAKGHARWSEKTFYLYDFATGKTRELVTTGAAQLAFLPGGRRMVQFDGIGKADLKPGLVAAPEVVVYDLIGEWKITLPWDVESDGFTAYPGTDKRFLMGQERNDTRDLYLVELPE